MRLTSTSLSQSKSFIVIHGPIKSIDANVLNRLEIELAIDEVLNDINAEIAKIVGHTRPKAIAVAGGFACSSYFMESLRNMWMWSEEGIDVLRTHDGGESAFLAVARGSLLRYDNISTQHLPSRYTYALLQDMYYDEDDHPDVMIQKRRFDPYGDEFYWATVKDDRVLSISKKDGTSKIVRDRLRIILPQGATAAGNNPILQEITQDYYISIAEPGISATFVYITDNTRVIENGPSRRPEDQDSFHAGIHLWKTVEVSLQQHKHRLQNLGFEKVYNSEGKKCWKVPATVIIKYKGGDNLRVGWEVVAPKYNLQMWSDGEVVWDAEHSEFIEGDVDMRDA